MKKNIFLLASFLFTTVLSPNVYAEGDVADGDYNVECTYKDPTNTIIANNDSLADGDLCYALPDTQKVTFIRAMLCTSFPDAGSSMAWDDGTPIDLSSCQLLWTSANGVAGSEVTISPNEIVPAAGEVSKPANGTYSYVYMEMAPTFKITTQKQFQETMTASVGTGNFCWSLAASTFSGTPTSAAKCGSAYETAGETNTTVNTLDAGAVSGDFYTSQGVYMRAFLMDSSYTAPLGASPGITTPVTNFADANNVSILGAAFPQEVIITDDFDYPSVFYSNTKGTQVRIDNDGDSTVTLGGFFAGPFDAYLEIHETPSSTNVSQ